MAGHLDAYLIPTTMQRLEQAGITTKEQLIELLQADNGADRLCALRGIGARMVMTIADQAYLDGIIDAEKRDAILDKVKIPRRRYYE